MLFFPNRLYKRLSPPSPTYGREATLYNPVNEGTFDDVLDDAGLVYEDEDPPHHGQQEDARHYAPGSPEVHNLQKERGFDLFMEIV